METTRRGIDAARDPDRRGADQAAAPSLDAALSRIATVRTESQIPKVVDLLRGRGVAVIVLKGPTTRSRLYAPDEDRPTADIDLLVPPRAFRIAGRALADHGHERVASVGHSDTFVGWSGAVDLHLALPYTTTAPGRSFARLAARTTTMPVAGRSIPVLDAPAHVLHLALHAAQNGFDPTHRSFEEWRRGRASLSARELAVAELLVDQLGAAPTWTLAIAALERPEAWDRLAAALPVRRPTPSMRGMWAFAAAPIPARIRGRALRSHVRARWSDDALAAWRSGRNLPPVGPGRSARWAAKTHRLLVEAGSRSTGRQR